MINIWKGKLRRPSLTLLIFFVCPTRTISSLEMDGTGHSHETDPLSLFSAESERAQGGSKISGFDAPRETASPLFLGLVLLTRGSSVPVCGLRGLLWVGSRYELEFRVRHRGLNPQSLWSWASVLTSLSFSLLICQKGYPITKRNTVNNSDLCSRCCAKCLASLDWSVPHTSPKTGL